MERQTGVQLPHFDLIPDTGPEPAPAPFPKFWDGYEGSIPEVIRNIIDKLPPGDRMLLITSCPGLTDGEARVLSVIAHHCGSWKLSYAQYPALMELAGKSEKALSKIIKKLERKGFIELERTYGAGEGYRHPFVRIVIKAQTLLCHGISDLCGLLRRFIRKDQRKELDAVAQAEEVAAAADARAEQPEPQPEPQPTPAAPAPAPAPAPPDEPEDAAPPFRQIVETAFRQKGETVYNPTLVKPAAVEREKENLIIDDPLSQPDPPFRQIVETGLSLPITAPPAEPESWVEEIAAIGAARRAEAAAMPPPKHTVSKCPNRHCGRMMLNGQCRNCTGLGPNRPSWRI